MMGGYSVALRFVLVATAVVSSSLAFAWSPVGEVLGRLLPQFGETVVRVPGLVGDGPTSTRTAFLASLIALSACGGLARLLPPATRTGAFTSAVLAFQTPGILAHSTLDWGGLLFDRPLFPPSLIPLTLTSGLALVTGASLLTAWLLARWQQDLERLEFSGVELNDRMGYLRNHVAIGGFVIGGGTVTTLAVMLLALAVSLGPRQAASLIPWPVVFLGGGAAALILGAVFFLRPILSGLESTVDQGDLEPTRWTG